MTRGILALSCCLALSAHGAPINCTKYETALQVLGVASNSKSPYPGGGLLFWHRGKVRVLIDAGIGTALDIQESQISTHTLDALLLSRIQANRLLDLDAVVALTESQQRSRPLPIFGPEAGKTTPSTVAFIRTLFDQKLGAYRDLGHLLSPLTKAPFKLEPHNVHRSGVTRLPRNPASEKADRPVLVVDDLEIHALADTDLAVPGMNWHLGFGPLPVHILSLPPVPAASLETPTANRRSLVLVLYEAPKAADIKKLNKIANTDNVKRLVIVIRYPITAAARDELTEAIAKNFKGDIETPNRADCVSL